MSETSEAAALEYLRVVIEDEDVTQLEVAKDFGISEGSLRKELRKIIGELDA